MTTVVSETPDRDLIAVVSAQVQMSIDEYAARHPAAAKILRRRSGEIGQYVVEYLSNDAVRAAMDAAVEKEVDIRRLAAFFTELAINVLGKFFPIVGAIA